MATSEKPFSPEEVHVLLMHGKLTTPAVFRSMVWDWPAAGWSPEYLATVLGGQRLRFRTGTRQPQSKDVLWETDCEYIDASLQQFCQWLDPASSQSDTQQDVPDNCADSTPMQTLSPNPLHALSQQDVPDNCADSTPIQTLSPNPLHALSQQNVPDSCADSNSMQTLSPNPLHALHPADSWAYLDYKYMAELFHHHPDILEAVRWADFGFPGRTGVESTMWVGSEGAHTPCHYDTYGCNLVLQVYGRKKWVLFPPEDSPGLYPTRVPYEESSVFSQVNVAHPDLHQHPRFVSCHPHVVVVQPGDVLFVPKHWWHYVESLSTSVSVNSWIEMLYLNRKFVFCTDQEYQIYVPVSNSVRTTSDVEDRLQEAVVRLVMLSIKSASDQSRWLNSTENVTSRVANLGYVQAALSEARANNTACTRTSDCTFAGGCPYLQDDMNNTPPPSKRSKLRDSGTDQEALQKVSLSAQSSWFGPNLVPVLPCTDYFTDNMVETWTCDITSDIGTSWKVKNIADKAEKSSVGVDSGTLKDELCHTCNLDKTRVPPSQAIIQAESCASSAIQMEPSQLSRKRTATGLGTGDPAEEEVKSTRSDARFFQQDHVQQTKEKNRVGGKVSEDVRSEDAAEQTLAEQSTAEQSAVAQAAGEKAAVKTTAVSSVKTAAKTAVKQTSAEKTDGEQSVAEKMAAELVCGSVVAAHSTPSCLEGSESPDMLSSREQELGLEELESTVVNCLVQPHVMQEVVKLLKERLRISQDLC